MGNHSTNASYHLHSDNHRNIIHHSKPISHHEVIPFSTLLVIIIPIIIVILFLAIFLLALVLRRLRHSKGDGGMTRNADTSEKNAVDSGDCMFIAHRTININTSTGGADGGCLYGTSLGGTAQCQVMRRDQLIQVFTLKEMETATNKFNEANIIGIGISGVVHKGVLRDGTVAAVKTMRTQGRYGERAFRLEVDLLSRLRSPYICDLLGYCADQQHRSLVFEYMPNSSLQVHLHQRQTPLNWAIRLKIALDCARALEYLHEHTSPSVIHRNLNCNNILLDRNFRAKLSGFGLAKVGSNKLNGLIATRVLGTTGYLAPEYASTGKLTTKSDTYSYGVILLELLTGREPIDTTRPPGEHVLVSWALPRLTKTEKLMEMIDPTIQGQFSLKDIIQVAAIAAMCVQTEADYRPLITDVVQSLMPLVKNINQSSMISPTSSLRSIHSPNPRILKY